MMAFVTRPDGTAVGAAAGGAGRGSAYPRPGPWGGCTVLTSGWQGLLNWRLCVPFFPSISLQGAQPVASL